MKKLRRTLGLFLTIALAFTAAIAAYAQTPGIMCEPVEPPTKVTIHKVVGTGGFKLKDHDGSRLTSDQIAELGNRAVVNNNGVEFTMWEVPIDADIDSLNDMTEDQLKNEFGKGDVHKAGVAFYKGNGTYYVRETKYPATLEGQLGVPFILELPAFNVAGTAYLKTLHLYPKNIIVDSKPTIDKDVRVKNNDNGGFDIGEVFDYLIYPMVPKGIQDYSRFSIRDRLSDKLDYMGEISVTYNGVAFVVGKDYGITEDAANTAGGGFTLTLTTKGLEKLADNRPETESSKDLEIKFKARINNNANMGESIINNAVLTYNNGYLGDKTTDVPVADCPEVHTGGRRFIKIDSVRNEFNSLLADAEFVVKKADQCGGYLYMAVDQDGNIAWVDADSATRITLNDDGSFEVKGLAYGDMGEAFEYWLSEAVTPEGYVQMNDIKFTINKHSYGNTYKHIPVTKVVNIKKPVIPQTGGIGTLVFLVTGLGLMGAAVVVLKRKGQSDE